jgi:hypothetical protein
MIQDRVHDSLLAWFGTRQPRNPAACFPYTEEARRELPRWNR